MTRHYRPLPLFIFSSSGAKKASDLPEPVSANTIASLSSMITGMACIWTGVGFLWPASLTPRRKLLLKLYLRTIELHDGASSGTLSRLDPSRTILCFFRS